MPPSKIILRPATYADADPLARLWMATFADKFGPVFGKNAQLIIRDWLRLSRRHLQTTVIAEVEGAVAGFVVLETPASPPPDDGRWLWHALQLHYGIIGAVRCLLLLLLIDDTYRVAQDEIYIEMLGVDPEWQRRGVARQLLQHAETVAAQAASQRLTLKVVTDNLAALRVYKKAGFVVRCEHHSRVYRWITGHPGYYEMEKIVGT
ncbi:MAG: GNAT family N-acetyltransferase [Anaerolineae bacterium]|nr:GNAT family N-acetyltransferase [Anaerolineae bacterium]